jgi:hypothetical protein
MLAEKMETTMKKGIRSVNHEVGSLNNEIHSKTTGTGMKDAIVIRALAITIL